MGIASNEPAQSPLVDIRTVVFFIGYREVIAESPGRFSQCVKSSLRQAKMESRSALQTRRLLVKAKHLNDPAVDLLGR